MPAICAALYNIKGYKRVRKALLIRAYNRMDFPSLLILVTMVTWTDREDESPK